MIELARAKVNLCLHVVGQRADGMHLLDSLVVFPEVGDVLTAEPSDTLTLTIDGPFGAGLSTEDNLIVKAAQSLGLGAKLHLQKNLPVASGIGGGSADAAATIRLLCELHERPLPQAPELAILGADVPVCLSQTPTRMTGVGENLETLPPLPPFWMVLANARIGVETGAVFKAMAKRDNPVISGIPAQFEDTAALFDFLTAQRNDMQAAALNICPPIGAVLSAISATKDCALARMSGSGGTCFGLYATQTAAEAAAKALQETNADWWVVAAKV